MKNKTAIAAVLSAVLLCSCGSGETDLHSGGEDSAVSQTENAESTANTEDTDSPPADDLTDADQEEILEEIRDTLADFSEFSYMYLKCKAYGEEGFLDLQDTVTADGMEYYRAADGDYTGYSALMAEIDRFCAETVVNECSLKGYSYREGENDALYIWKDAGSDGGVMGSDIAYIDSAEVMADNSVILHMKAWGDGEFWGYPDGEDIVIDFDITMARYDGLWKLTKCGVMEMDYLTWLFNPDYEG